MPRETIRLGQRFDELITVERLGLNRKQNRLYRCLCDCGNETTVSGSDLKSGNTKSCGCRRKAITRKRNKLQSRWGGASKEPLYHTWAEMISRCYNENNLAYNNYGGRGIGVCDRWRLDPWAFFADMGQRPKGASIDRIDNDGNYEPSNCRWATPKQQSENQRRKSSQIPLATEEALWKRYCEGNSTLRELGLEFGVKPTTVPSVIRRLRRSAATRS